MRLMRRVSMKRYQALPNSGSKLIKKYILIFSSKYTKRKKKIFLNQQRLVVGHYEFDATRLNIILCIELK